MTAHQRECVADILRTPRSPDPMDIILRMLGHIVIDLVTVARVFQPALCYVGRYHHFVFAALETFERFDPFALCPVGMQNSYGMLRML